MKFVYPYVSTREGESTIVHFPDVPGAMTQVDPGEDFNESVRDCLIAALGGYVALRQSPPRPSVARAGPTVTLDILTSAKLALAMATSDLSISNVTLAECLGVDEKIVRRLLDLDHISRIDRIETALECLGLQLELSVLPKSNVGQDPFRVPM